MFVLKIVVSTILIAYTLLLLYLSLSTANKYKETSTTLILLNILSLIAIWGR